MAFEFTPTGQSRAKSILISDFDKLVKDLKKLDPQLRKDFDKALKAAAKPLVERFVGMTEQSGKNEIKKESGVRCKWQWRYLWVWRPSQNSSVCWFD